MTTETALLSGSPPTSPEGTADSPNQGQRSQLFVQFSPQPIAMESPKLSPNTKQNQVGTAVLRSVPIVSLFIDGKERLCLAQISNTLLRDFSYNEIHNRRVALGITCIQCTPVQLEILRRAGAMPVSSRRCGMITKREAERLVKSFLEDTTPPQLPENFCFDVYHECGWGCRGSFLPSRYNSSRAKCIKCYFCNNFFSPNKFIFHCHKMPGAIYRHPDAANFNSWRRHLKLTNKEASDDLMHAWEDVKAMFNGGSRKRLTSSHGQSPIAHDMNDNNIESKRPRLDIPQYPRQQTYPYPMFAAVGANPYRLFGNMFPRPSHPAFSLMPMEQTTLTPERKINQDMLQGKPVQNPYSFLWGKGLDNMAIDTDKAYANKLKDELFRERNFEAMRNSFWQPDYLNEEESPSPPPVNRTASPCLSADASYSSAFTPVKRDAELSRKNRKNKPRKGMRIGAIADSILQRNMLASFSQSNLNSDEDNVDIEVSDDEVDNSGNVYLHDHFTKEKMDGLTGDTGPAADKKTEIAVSELLDSKSEPTERSRNIDAGDDLVERVKENLAQTFSDATVTKLVDTDASNLDTSLAEVGDQFERREPNFEVNEGDLTTSEDLRDRMDIEGSGDKPPPVKTYQANETVRIQKHECNVMDKDHQPQNDLLRELTELQQLRQRAEREYKAIEAVTASGETEHSHQELQRKLADAHDALLQFSNKVMTLTSGLGEAKSY